LAQRTYSLVFASLFRLCGGDRDAASELTQETYRKAWESPGTLSRKAGFATWLFRIAYNSFLALLIGLIYGEKPAITERRPGVKTLSIAVLVVVLALPVVAGAGERNYVFFGAGLSLPSAFEMPVYSGPDFRSFAVENTIDPGFRLSFGAGTRVAEKLRLEGEIGYRFHTVDDVEQTANYVLGTRIAGGNGHIRSLSLMGNAWYEVPFDTRWTFYFGGGGGLEKLSLNDFTLVIETLVPTHPESELLYINSNDWKPAYQIGLGIACDSARTSSLMWDSDSADRPTPSSKMCTETGSRSRIKAATSRRH
jgi:opacity protein-like surface antigen